MAREPQVKIENPLMGGNALTSLSRARRFVDKGRAVFVGPAIIRFLDSSQQQKIRLAAEKRLHSHLTGGGYDCINRMLGEREMRNLPIVSPAKLLRSEKSDRDWSYTAATRHSIARADTAEEVAAIRQKKARG